MFDTNTVFFETAPNSEQYLPITQDVGQFFHFYGNKCHHYNVLNETGQTRISFDFRVIPLKRYDPQYSKKSMTQGKEFLVGDYFVLMRRDDQ